VDERDAVIAGVVALAVAAALTPLTAPLARRVGAINQPSGRGLSERPTPRLGGLAMLVAVLVAGLIWLPGNDRMHGILAGAAVITLVGALDDARPLPPGVKLLGQIGAALIPVLSGVSVTDFTIPFAGAVDLGGLSDPISVLAIVAVANVVNFSDGVDGLAAGVCAITALAFSIIAFDLGNRGGAAILAAIVAGAALGFLVHNFPPAKVFMGDGGANLLGYMLACVAIEGTIKTQAVVSLILPLILLAVPFLDTTFVVLRRMKYRRPVYAADAEHFHHRLSRIGFNQRRTILFLYTWTLLLAGLALAIRFVPYSDNRGHFALGWSVVMGAIFVLVGAASVYLVYVLEILKFRRFVRRARPDATEAEIDEAVSDSLETGEFDAVR